MLAVTGSDRPLMWTGRSSASQDAVGGHGRAVTVAIVEHHHELVAAVPARRCPLAAAAAQASGDLDQQLVADRMAERVVDVLEVVDVEEQERHLAIGRRVANASSISSRSSARLGRPVSAS